MCYFAPLFSMAANGFGRGRDRSSHPIHMVPQEENLATLGELLWQRGRVAFEEPTVHNDFESFGAAQYDQSSSSNGLIHA